MILVVEKLKNMDLHIWFNTMHKIYQAKQGNKVFQLTPQIILYWKMLFYKRTYFYKVFMYYIIKTSLKALARRIYAYK